MVGIVDVVTEEVQPEDPFEVLVANEIKSVRKLSVRNKMS